MDIRHFECFGMCGSFHEQVVFLRRYSSYQLWGPFWLPRVFCIRRLFFEIFLKPHWALPVLLLIRLWAHIDISSTFDTILLGVASALRIIQTSCWILQLAFRNVGGRPVDSTRVQHLLGEQAVVEATLLEIQVRRPWRAVQGQYVYIILPCLPHSLFSRFQTHLYLVAWTEDDHHRNCKSVTLLIETRHGFSDKLRLLQENDEVGVVLDGPYGGGPALDMYDKVVFIATGIDIAAHLLSIRQLIEGHNN